MSQVDWQKVKALAYEEAATTPHFWLVLAEDLRRAAEAVWSSFEEALPGRGKPYRGESFPFGYGAVFLMLAGLAIENLAKGLTVEKNPPKIKDGKAVGIMGHGILKHLKPARIRVTASDHKFIQRLEMFALWAGRYPIPTNASNMQVEKTINTTDRQQFEKLYEQLKTNLMSRMRDSQ